MQNLTIAVDFDRFPPEHTCDGEDLSPRIRVLGSNAPYLAVIVDDPDAPRGTFTHWLAWNIPSTGEIPAGIPQEPRISHPVSAVQGMNDFRRTGYSGPCPREVHHTATSSGYGALRVNSTSLRGRGGPSSKVRSRQPPPATARLWRSTSAGRRSRPRRRPGPAPDAPGGFHNLFLYVIPRDVS